MGDMGDRKGELGASFGGEMSSKGLLWTLH